MWAMNNALNLQVANGRKMLPMKGTHYQEPGNEKGARTWTQVLQCGMLVSLAAS